ncbi:MAG: hypothetical protein PHC61_19255 [Chitinivibrionales bacterium]|nr:hypothetical protein [Chitinivibrionales bacterium]
MFKKILAGAALACLFLFGCANHPPALAQDTGKASIVVLFPKQQPDSKLATPVMLNGRQMTVLQAGSYCEFPVSDGEYSLQAGESSPDQDVVPPKIDVIISAGSTKYVELSAQSTFKDGKSILSITPAQIAAPRALGMLSGLKKVAP